MNETPFKHLDGTDPLVFWPYCHPAAPLRVTLHYSGVMVLSCVECNQECGRFKAEEFVYGEYKCPVCGFRFTEKVLNPSTGEMGAPVVTEFPLCHRDSEVMLPLTWREASLEMSKIASTYLKRSTALEAAWPEGYAIPVDEEFLDDGSI